MTMKDKTIIINQFRGLGDVLFLIPMVRHLMENGNRVIFPTYFTDLQKHFPDVLFVEKTLLNIDYNCREFRETNGALVLPIRFADSIMGLSYRNHMGSKYRIMDLPVNMWRTLTWERDKKAERRLFHKVLELRENSDYALVQEVFTTEENRRTTINPPTMLPQVKLEPTKGFTLLDWGMVIENATEIYAVSTSSLYLFEIMELKAKELHLYTRTGVEDHFDYVNYLLQKDWVFHK